MSDKLTLTLTEDFDTIISFRGERLVWDTSIYRKTNLKDKAFDVFAEINAFIRPLRPQTQENMFSCYKEIRSIFDRVDGVKTMTRKIIPLIKQLSQNINHDQLIVWVRVSANLVIPDVFETAYIDPTTTMNKDIGKAVDPTKTPMNAGRQVVQASTRERTYLRDDYVELVALTIGLRLMFPIWGEFILLTSDETGTSWKEFYAGKLIEGSSFYHTRAYDKLYTYIEASIGPGEQHAAAILDGLSSEDRAIWALNLILIRRIAIGDVRGVNNVRNGSIATLVSFVHAYIQARVINHDTNFSLDRIRDKTPGSNSDDEESKLTVFETIRISEEHSPGDIQELIFYATSLETMVDALCPHLDRQVLNQCLQAAKPLLNEKIWKPQVRILQWLIGPYLPPNSVLNLDKTHIVNILAVMQAILWTHGFKDLATILTLSRIVRPVDSDPLPHVTRSNIPKNMVEELMALYPHYRRPSSRSSGDSPNHYVVINMIKTMTTELLEFTWRHHLPEGWIQELDQRQHANLMRNEYRIPSDIRIQLSRLCILIAKHPYPFHQRTE